MTFWQSFVTRFRRHHRHLEHPINRRLSLSGESVLVLPFVLPCHARVPCHSRCPLSLIVSFANATSRLIQVSLRSRLLDCLCCACSGPEHPSSPHILPYQHCSPKAGSHGTECFPDKWLEDKGQTSAKVVLSIFNC